MNDLTVVAALRSGDVDAVRGFLAARPSPANAHLSLPGRRGGRTPLMILADWPGYYPNAPELVRLLIEAGADPSGTVDPPPTETPLHWAASSDDVEVATALLDGGADIEAPGASIAGGPPLDDAVGYGCWHVAHLLHRRGARVDRLWHASALGDLPRLASLASSGPPSQSELDEAFWHACAGGQRRTAEYLLSLGASVVAQPSYASEPPLAAAVSPGTRRTLLADWLRSRGAPDPD